MKAKHFELTLEPQNTIKSAFLILLGIDFVVAFFDVFLNHYQWAKFGPLMRFFNITREDSFANWYASAQLLITGFILIVIFAIERASARPKSVLWGWAIIAGFFSYMGIDEATKFHERLGSSFKLLMEENGSTNQMLSAFPSYPWQLLLLPFFGSMGLFIAWFLYKELKTWNLRAYIVCALGLYVVAVGLDFVEGLQGDPYANLAIFFNSNSEDIRHFSKVIEETIELIGTTFFLITFLKHFLSLEKSILIKVEK